MDNKKDLPYKKLFGIKIIKFRIVTDNYLGFECQKWCLWYPFWVQINFVNTHSNINDAIEFIENINNKSFERKVVLN